MRSRLRIWYQLDSLVQGKQREKLLWSFAETQEDQGEIYLIRNSITEELYIGQTKCLKKVADQLIYRGYLHRFRDHLREAEKGSRACPKLYRALRQYGSEIFQIRLLERCARINLNLRERYYIKRYQSRKNGYNKSAGGQFSHRRRWRKKKATSQKEPVAKAPPLSALQRRMTRGGRPEEDDQRRMTRGG